MNKTPINASVPGFANCATIDPELFFQENTEQTTLFLRDICATCQILVQCEMVSLTHDYYGFWAGMTREERTRIRRNPKRAGRKT